MQENYEEFIHWPWGKEFKETIKNARKKLETSVAPTMPCKNSQHGATRGKSNEIKLKLACILEASESTRLRMGGSLPNHHEDHIAGKRDNSLQHYKLVHKFILIPLAMKIPAAKAAVDKEWEKLEKIPAWDLTKVRSKKEVIDEARTKGAKVHFAWWTSVIWTMQNWRQSTQKTKVELYSEVILWKMILDLTQYLQNKGHQHHKWQQEKSWISSPDCQGAQDKQLMQCLLIPRWKWKMLQNYWQFPNRSVQTFGFVHHDIMAKIMVQYGRCEQHTSHVTFSRTCMLTF